MKFKLHETNVTLGEPILDVVTEPGDFLYIPSGVIHQAIGAGEPGDLPSLHVTIGVESATLGTWEALLLDLVARATEKAPEVADLRCGGAYLCVQARLRAVLALL